MRHGINTGLVRIKEEKANSFLKSAWERGHNLCETYSIGTQLILEDVNLVRSKYLKPAAYARKIRLVVARILLRYGIPLKNTTKEDGFVIKFRATSFLEYFLRAEESYVREEVTMYWIRNYINPDDVVYDVGANIGVTA